MSVVWILEFLVPPHLVAFRTLVFEISSIKYLQVSRCTGVG